MQPHDIDSNDIKGHIVSLTDAVAELRDQVIGLVGLQPDGQKGGQIVAQLAEANTRLTAIEARITTIEEKTANVAQLSTDVEKIGSAVTLLTGQTIEDVFKRLSALESRGPATTATTTTPAGKRARK